MTKTRQIPPCWDLFLLLLVSFINTVLEITFQFKWVLKQQIEWQNLNWLERHLLLSWLPSQLVLPSTISHFSMQRECKHFFLMFSEILHKLHRKQGGNVKQGSKYVQYLFMYLFISFHLCFFKVFITWVSVYFCSGCNCFSYTTKHLAERKKTSSRSVQDYKD